MSEGKVRGEWTCPQCGGADFKVRMNRTTQGDKVWINPRNECRPCKRARDRNRVVMMRSDPVRCAKRMRSKRLADYRRGNTTHPESREASRVRRVVFADILLMWTESAGMTPTGAPSPRPTLFPVPAEVRKQGSGAMYRYKWDTYPEFQARERERQQRYKHANPDVAARWGKRHKVQIQAQADGSLSPVVVRRLFAEARHCPCPYCGEDYTTVNPMVLDHIEPISRGGKHALGNVGVVCRRCNREKWAHPITEWIARLPHERRSLASAYVDAVRGLRMDEAA